MSKRPQAYVEGVVDFYNVSLLVDESVLIPRLESELLVEHALKRIEKRDAVVLDLCCGSGALGLALKKARPDLQLILSDLSEKCVEKTRLNAIRNGLSVDIRCGDLLATVKEKVDYVLCNPPYVTLKEYEELEPSVRLFEPKLALVGGEDGLLFYRRLAKELPPFLRTGAKVFFEIGKDLGPSVKEIFSNAPWCDGEVLCDYALWDRFFIVAFSVERM